MAKYEFTRSQGDYNRDRRTTDNARTYVTTKIWSVFIFQVPFKGHYNLSKYDTSPVLLFVSEPDTLLLGLKVKNNPPFALGT